MLPARSAAAAVLSLALVSGLCVLAFALFVVGKGYTLERFSSDDATPYKRSTARNGSRLADEIHMTQSLNDVGKGIVGANANTMCRVAGTTVNAFETSVSLDSDIVSCTISRFMLKPLTFSLSGDAVKDTRLLEKALTQSPVVAATCRPNSSLCTVEFDKTAPAQDVVDFNSMMSTRFGVSALSVSDVTGNGTTYVLLPNGRNGQEPKRMTVRVEDDGSKSFMVYKFSSACSETPLDLWMSGGRNVDEDIALNPDTPTMPYASDLLTEGAWSAFQFSHVVVEARKGSTTVCRMKFRATTDRQKWFHPKFLVQAEFGGLAAGPNFVNRAFQKFALADQASRLYFCVMDELDDGAPCSAQRFFMCVPFRANACPAYDTLNARVVATPEPEAVVMDGYNASTTTHLVVWLTVSASSIQKSDEDVSAYTGPDGLPRFPSLLEQRPPPNIFAGAAARPNEDVPVILSNNCGGAPGWELRLNSAGAYSERELRDLLLSQRKSLRAGLTDTSSPSLMMMTRVRFHKSHRVVLFGEGRSLSPDAEYVAVLQDSRLAASYNTAGVAKDWSLSRPLNVRYADGRPASIAYDDKTSDNDGSFLEACLVGTFDSSVRSIIVEKINDSPVVASTRCSGPSQRAWEVQLHVGHYDAKQHTDLLANSFDPRNLRSFQVARGYSLVLFPQAGFGGQPLTVAGPDTYCVPSAQQQPFQSLRVLRT